LTPPKSGLSTPNVDLKLWDVPWNKTCLAMNEPDDVDLLNHAM
jgi:hypothetical protein